MALTAEIYNTGKPFMQKEFSYPLTVADLPLAEQHYHLEASPADLSLLARILQVGEVKSFAADFRVKPDHHTSILSVSGHIKTEIVQQSVVSLEDFSSVYDFDFSTLFDTRATLESQKEDGDDWDKDTPEIVVGGKIDLGDIAVEQVALRLDDYPRKPGEEFSFVSEFDDKDTAVENPFAVLAKLKK